MKILQEKIKLGKKKVKNIEEGLDKSTMIEIITTIETTLKETNNHLLQEKKAKF